MCAWKEPKSWGFELYSNDDVVVISSRAGVGGRERVARVGSQMEGLPSSHQIYATGEEARVGNPSPKRSCPSKEASVERDQGRIQGVKLPGERVGCKPLCPTSDASNWVEVDARCVCMIQYPSENTPSHTMAGYIRWGDDSAGRRQRPVKYRPLNSSLGLMPMPRLMQSAGEGLIPTSSHHSDLLPWTTGSIIEDSINYSAAIHGISAPPKWRRRSGLMSSSTGILIA